MDCWTRSSSTARECNVERTARTTSVVAFAPLSYRPRFAATQSAAACEEVPATNTSRGGSQRCHGTNGAEVANAGIAKAEELIQQPKEDMGNNEFDLAEGVMEQFGKVRDSLSESLQEQVDKHEEMLSSSGRTTAGR